jgi:hypothetical protein
MVSSHIQDVKFHTKYFREVHRGIVSFAGSADGTDARGVHLPPLPQRRESSWADAIRSLIRAGGLIGFGFG